MLQILETNFAWVLKSHLNVQEVIISPRLTGGAASFRVTHFNWYFQRRGITNPAWYNITPYGYFIVKCVAVWIAMRSEYHEIRLGIGSTLMRCLSCGVSLDKEKSTKTKRLASFCDTHNVLRFWGFGSLGCVWTVSGLYKAITGNFAKPAKTQQAGPFHHTSTA